MEGGSSLTKHCTFWWLYSKRLVKMLGSLFKCDIISLSNDINNKITMIVSLQFFFSQGKSFSLLSQFMKVQQEQKFTPRSGPFSENVDSSNKSSSASLLPKFDRLDSSKTNSSSPDAESHETPRMRIPLRTTSQMTKRRRWTSRGPSKRVRGAASAPPEEQNCPKTTN